MMHDYKQIRAELRLQGFTEEKVWGISHMIETEDIIIEILFFEECRDQERVIASNEMFWGMLVRLLERDQVGQLLALRVLSEQVEIERAQRRQLAATGSRQNSIFLSAVLKYFCGLTDWQVVVVSNILNPQKDGGGGFSMGMGL
jgi:hypothetical protein